MRICADVAALPAAKRRPAGPSRNRLAAKPPKRRNTWGHKPQLPLTFTKWSKIDRRSGSVTLSYRFAKTKPPCDPGLKPAGNIAGRYILYRQPQISLASVGVLEMVGLRRA